MNAAIVDQIWSLCKLGSARSSGWGGHDTPHTPGSGYLFAYGHAHPSGEHTAGVTLYNAAGTKRTIDPATKGNVLEALIDMGITETSWSL